MLLRALRRPFEPFVLHALIESCRTSTDYLTVMVIFFDITGGSCGIWFLSPKINCNVCLPGGSSIVASVCPPPKAYAENRQAVAYQALDDSPPR